MEASCQFNSPRKGLPVSFEREAGCNADFSGAVCEWDNVIPSGSPARLYDRPNSGLVTVSTDFVTATVVFSSVGEEKRYRQNNR
jgi:hypothetical protein